MNGLFKKVTSGVFEQPKGYSPDLTKLITSMIKVNPKDRPSSEQILRSKELQKQIKKLELIKPNLKELREERSFSLL